MADSTISGLSAAAQADRTMEVPVNKGGGENAKVTLEQIINLVSDTISDVRSIAQVPASVTSAEFASVLSGAPGGGSVTSAEVQTASAAATSVDARVNTVSNLVSQNIVSIAELSTHLSVVSNAASDALSHAAAASAAATSVLTYVCATSAKTSAAASVKGLQSIVNALSGRISDVEAHASTASAAVTSVNARIISILSNEISVLEEAISTTLSAVRSAVSNVSAQSAAGSATGLQAVVDLLSNKISQINAGAGLTSSQVSDMIGSVNGANYSCRIYAGTSVKGLQSIIDSMSNTFSNAFSAGSILSGNVTSLQCAVQSINDRFSAISARSIGVSTKGTQSAINALSNTISMNYGRCRIITATIAASVGTALADIAGTTVDVSAGNYYQYTARLNMAMSAANAFGIGITFPSQVAGAAGGFMMGAGSVGASAWQSTIGNIQIMTFDDDGSGSVILSVVKGVVSASPVMIEAQFAPSANGVIKLQYRASVSTSNVKVNPGSYVRCFRLVDTGQ